MTKVETNSLPEENNRDDDTAAQIYNFTIEPDYRKGMLGWFDIWCRFGGTSSCVARVYGEKRAEIVRDALSEEANELVE